MMHITQLTHYIQPHSCDFCQKIVLDISKAQVRDSRRFHFELTLEDIVRAGGRGCSLCKWLARKEENYISRRRWKLEIALCNDFVDFYLRHVKSNSDPYGTGPHYIARLQAMAISGEPIQQTFSIQQICVGKTDSAPHRPSSSTRS
jgi:hypothetical protein